MQAHMLVSNKKGSYGMMTVAEMWLPQRRPNAVQDGRRTVFLRDFNKIMVLSRFSY
jgi:hypothetical protein